MRLKNRFNVVIFAFATVISFYTPILNAQTHLVLEAENATLGGTAEIVNCNSASGGKMVKGLDGDKLNSVTFQGIQIPQEGEYLIIVSYFSTSPRNLNYRINNERDGIHSVEASGQWCYQGGRPGTVVFTENFRVGENSLQFFQSPIIDKIEIKTDTARRDASTFYIHSVSGNDANDGQSAQTPWKTLERINSLDLVPGDSVLFCRNDTVKGRLVVYEEGGTKGLPVFIGSYGEGALPVIDGIGFFTTIHIINSGFLEISDIEIKNDGGGPQPGEPENIRYGIYLENTLNDGTVFDHYRLRNLIFKNIFPTLPVTDDDQTGVNGYAIITSGSWGDDLHPTRFSDMQIENCLFTRTARHAAMFKAVDSLVIRNNLFEHTGGAGMVIGNNCTNILVEHNITNYTGSKIDERMAGRGSGLWCFRSRNLTVQHNQFKHARGIHDSYGMHIDIGNRNVVYQYNFSEDNEGGFVEILGKNVNVGYRYNLSIGDGWRKRGNRFGQIFWLAGWSGDPKNPVGSDSIFIYNNSIYVRDTVAPGIWIESVSKNARIYNNIIYAAGQFGPVVIKNDPSFNDFDYNVWRGNIPTRDENGRSYRGRNAKTFHPLFSDEIITTPEGFILQPESPALNAGKLIYNPFHTGDKDYFFTHGGEDYFGNPVPFDKSPDIGAFNHSAPTRAEKQGMKNSGLLQFYPNPATLNGRINIEIPVTGYSETVEVQISDMTGKIIFNQKTHANNKVQIRPPFSMPGIYLIQLKSEKLCKAGKLQVIGN